MTAHGAGSPQSLRLTAGGLSVVRLAWLCQVRTSFSADEPRWVYRRLHSLRGWGHGETEQVFSSTRLASPKPVSGAVGASPARLCSGAVPPSSTPPAPDNPRRTEKHTQFLVFKRCFPHSSVQIPFSKSSCPPIR